MSDTASTSLESTQDCMVEQLDAEVIQEVKNEEEEEEGEPNLRNVFSLISGDEEVITAAMLLVTTGKMGFDFTHKEIKDMIDVADRMGVGQLSRKDFATMVYTSKEEITGLQLSNEEIRREITRLSILDASDKEALDGEATDIPEEGSEHNKGTTDNDSTNNNGVEESVDRTNDILLTRLDTESDSYTNISASVTHTDDGEDCEDEDRQGISKQNRMAERRHDKMRTRAQSEGDSQTTARGQEAQSPEEANSVRTYANNPRTTPIGRRPPERGRHGRAIINRNKENSELSTRSKTSQDNVQKEPDHRRASKPEVRYVRRERNALRRSTSVEPGASTVADSKKVQAKSPTKVQVVRRKSNTLVSKTPVNNRPNPAFRTSNNKDTRAGPAPGVKPTQRPSAMGCVYKLSRVRMKQRVLYTMWRALFQQIVDTHYGAGAGK